MDNKNFYENFESNSSKQRSFKNNIFVPFFSGLLGATLVIGLVLGIPKFRTSETSSKVYNTSDLSQNSNNTTDLVSINNYSDTAIYVANKVLPSIVGITVEYTVNSNFLRGISQTVTAEGSGIIISNDGYILTNNHIINSNDSSSFYEVTQASNVYVYLYNDKTPYEAEIIGTDKKTDLAVIKISKNDLTSAEFGNSSSIQIGEFAMAIGNPLGMQSSVTSGIISAVNRTVTSEDGNTYTLIQTDAAINSGNSGGALVNSTGKVIGINTLKLSGTGIEGMGFAIPINNTIDIYKQLISNGKVLRPYIGIYGIDLDEKTATANNLPTGIYIKSIQKSSPASDSDLNVGDVIISVNNSTVSSMDELNKIKESLNIGDKITLEVSRNGENKKVEITLAEEP